MLRKIVNAQHKKLTIQVPDEYIKHKLEILIFPIDEKEDVVEKSIGKLKLTRFKCNGKKKDFTRAEAYAEKI